jgi:hypothetical protein
MWLLAEQEHEVQSDFSSLVLSTFVQVIVRTRFDITADHLDGLAALAEEWGHLMLAAACGAFRYLVLSRSNSESQEALTREIRAVWQEREVLSLRQELRY